MASRHKYAEPLYPCLLILRKDRVDTHLLIFLRFLGFSQGSLSEVEYYLHLARRLEYIDDNIYESIESKRSEVGRTLTGFINAIRKQTTP